MLQFIGDFPNNAPYHFNFDSSFIYNCPCNVHGRNHGDKVKLRPQFCKWRN